MQQWEYCQLLVPRLRKESARLVRFLPAGPERIEIHPDAGASVENANDAAYRLIAQLGSEGWEMVTGAAAGIYTQSRLYVFKRLLP